MKQIFQIESKRKLNWQEVLGALEDTVGREIIQYVEEVEDWS
jgi:hypothetical protein